MPEMKSIEEVQAYLSAMSALCSISGNLDAIKQEIEDTAQQFEKPLHCAYHPGCSGQAEHQCPVCKKWYCAECREMFLPIDPAFWIESAMQCAQCHYNRGDEIWH